MRMSQVLDTARDDNGWHCQAQKRVMGLEPTTSTLATCTPTAANQRNDNNLQNPTPPSAGLMQETRQAKAPAAPAAPDLTAWVEACPVPLPPAIRAGILAIVGAAAGGQA